MSFLTSKINHTLVPEFYGSLENLVAPDTVKEYDILMIACSDHGSAPDNVSFAPPGRMMILQHLGASIPNRSECRDGLNIAAINQILDEKPISQIIVCGHLNCQVIKTWIGASNDELDYAQFRSRFLSGTLKPVQEAYPEMTGEELVEYSIHEHVLMQLENLASHPNISSRLNLGTLKLHGWVVDDKSARIKSFDPASKSFQLL